MYTAITVTLDSSGASTGQAKRRYVCSTPVSTMPTPYSGSCGAKIRSMSVRGGELLRVVAAVEQPDQRPGGQRDDQRRSAPATRSPR